MLSKSQWFILKLSLVVVLRLHLYYVINNFINLSVGSVERKRVAFMKAGDFQKELLKISLEILLNVEKIVKYLRKLINLEELFTHFSSKDDVKNI